ncbi:MAG: methyltransferase domain-containing protein [Actinocrinis sp.]
MADDRTARVNGLDVRVRTFGEPTDPAILLLAEAARGIDAAQGADAQSADAWPDAFCERLAEGLRFVVRYEGRGAALGDEDAADAVYTSADLALDALGVLDALNISVMHLVTTAADTPIGRLLAVEQPDRVASLSALPDPSANAGAALDWDEAVRVILQNTSGGWQAQGDRLASRAIAGNDPTGWFDRLYRAAVSGQVSMPWNRSQPDPLLFEWAVEHAITGAGRRAVVVGCGLGADAQYVAGLGFDTIGFDIAESAINLAKQRHPGSAVRYMTADLLNLPDSWLHAFDLVVEVFTVQALPDPPRRRAIANVSRLVAPRGTLLAIEFARDDWTPAADTPPFPLSRAEVGAFGSDGLTPLDIEQIIDHHPVNPDSPAARRWRAQFRRAAALSGA